MMLKAGKFKRRLVLIVFLCMVTIFVSWQFAISSSLNTFQEVKEMQYQLEVLENAPQEIAATKQKIVFVDQMIGKSAGNIRQEDIVNKVSAYISGGNVIQLCSMPPVHTFKKQEYLVKTYSLELQGDFHELVKFLYHFEKNKTIGKISSVDFYTIKDSRTKKISLRLKLLIQSFIKNDSSHA